MAVASRKELGVHVYMNAVISNMEIAVRRIAESGNPVTNLTQVIAYVKSNFGPLSFSNKYVPEASDVLFNPDIKLWTNQSLDQVDLMIVNTFPLGSLNARYYHGQLGNGFHTMVSELPTNYVHLQSLE